ncbi:MAG: transglutaminase family protein [Bacteroidota bacterium]
MATDDRFKTAKLSQESYPFTVEYTGEHEIRGLMYFQAWRPLYAENLSVQRSSLKVIVPASLDIRFLEENMPAPAKVSMTDGKKIYFWTVDNLKTVEKQAYGPKFDELVPIVHLGPNDFEIDNRKGNASTWKEFGKFFYELNDNRQKLPASLAQKVRDLTADKKSKEAKIRTLYQYMQDNTRYVSIQLGIGGWQTFTPEYVYENGYGDCKALSNYMKSMLQEVGIESHVAAVYAGANAADIKYTFPSSQFNHVILCVPNGQDTVWLECTSSNLPSGYLSDFTEDRHVLLYTEEGGKLVKTPSSTPEQNLQFRQVAVRLKDNGNADVKTRVFATGSQQDDFRRIDDEASEKEQEEFVQQRIDAGSFDLIEYDFQEVPHAPAPGYQLSYEIQATNWAKQSGSRIFLKPNVLGKLSVSVPKVDERKQKIVLKANFLDRDSVLYHLPEGYTIESKPELPLEIKSSFGYYKCDIQIPEAGSILYIREMRMTKTELPASEYETLRNFFRQLSKADNLQIVLSNRS